MHRFLEWHAGRCMTREARTVSPDTTLRELEALFAENDFNAFPVVEDGKMVGLVTKFDFLKAFAFNTRQILPKYDLLMGIKVADVMTTAVVHVGIDDPLTRVLQLMVDLRARSFPVLDEDGKLAGVISRTDLMSALKQATSAV